MTDIFDRRGNGAENDGRPHESAADLDTLPLISRLMLGNYSEKEKKWLLPSHSLIAWLEGSLVGFLFNAGEDHERLFGRSSGLKHGLQGIEAALQQGNCEWKQPKSSKRR